MAMFDVGDDYPVMDVLGVRYGKISAEGREEPVGILTIEQGRAALKKAVDDGYVNGDDAPGLETQMREAGLFETWKDVAEHVAAFAVPTGFVSAYTFEVCTGDCGIPLPHGKVIRDIGEGESEIMFSVSALTEAFQDTSRMGDQIHPIDAAVVLAKIAATNIPIDAEARKQMCDNLPEEVRAQLELELEQRPQTEIRTALADLFGTSGVVMITGPNLATFIRLFMNNPVSSPSDD